MLETSTSVQVQNNYSEKLLKSTKNTFVIDSAYFIQYHKQILQFISIRKVYIYIFHLEKLFKKPNYIIIILGHKKTCIIADRLDLLLACT